MWWAISILFGKMDLFGSKWRSCFEGERCDDLDLCKLEVFCDIVSRVPVFGSSFYMFLPRLLWASSDRTL